MAVALSPCLASTNMTNVRYQELPAAKRRRLVFWATLRSVLAAAVLVVLYYVLPLDQRWDSDTAVRLLIGLLVFAAVMVWQVRSIAGSRFPGLRALARMTRAQSVSVTVAEKLRLLQALGGPKLLVHRMPPPPQKITQARRWLAGRLHSKRRDAQAIAHHYDVSNRFYGWVLGPSMAYTWPVTRTRTRPWNRRRRTSSTWSPASWGCVTACGCWMSAAAGAAW